MCDRRPAQLHEKMDSVQQVGIEPVSPLLKARYLAIPKSFIMYRVARLVLRFLGVRAK